MYDDHIHVHIIQQNTKLAYIKPRNHIPKLGDTPWNGRGEGHNAAWHLVYTKLTVESRTGKRGP